MTICPECPRWLAHFKKRMDELLFKEQSTTTRLWFGIVTIFFGVFAWFSPTITSPHSEYELMMELAPYWLWALAYWVNGAAYLYGAYTNKYSKIQLMLEGTLGVTAWVGSAYAVSVAQGVIGAHAGGALLAFWLYVRYPTHWEGSR